MTPPIAMPPAIIQPMQVAQAAPTVPIQRNANGEIVMPTVQLPLDTIRDDQRIRDAGALAICANITDPHGGDNISKATPAQARSVLARANRCVALVENAVRNGTITDVPAITLALRSIPFTNPEGNDNVAETLDDIATQIATKPPSTLKFDYNPSTNTPQASTPFTLRELSATITVDGRRALPTMRPSRSIPVDPSTSYIMTAADVVVHPTRYIDEGKTLAETIATARANHTAVNDKKLATLCMVNDGSLTLQDCQAAAGRNTLEMIHNGQAGRYAPNFYIPNRTSAQR